MSALVSTLRSMHTSVPAGELCDLVRLLRNRSTVVLAGAGCSTESGIPDYRGPTTQQKKRSPVQYREFVSSPAWRQRYWARAVVGWPNFTSARPNETHRSLAELEKAGIAPWLITQNVDGLHQEAGSRTIVELHGTLHQVKCLECDYRVPRDEHQRALLERNAFVLEARGEVAPDGDAELAPELVERFEVLPCARCGGVLKPDVVYFGENVPKARVETAFSWVDRAEALLVVGSSLSVFSGYRFVRRAKERGIPVGILNLGPTRGDPLADVKVEGRLGLALPIMVSSLLAAQKRILS